MSKSEYKYTYIVVLYQHSTAYLYDKNGGTVKRAKYSENNQVCKIFA